MTYKQRTRKGPTISATKYSIGTKKRGKDGNIWVIAATTSGTRRWRKQSNATRLLSKRKRKTRKPARTSGDVTFEQLKKMKKKYAVTTTGSKHDIAEGLWRVRSHSMDSQDLTRIVPLLAKSKQSFVKKILRSREDSPIVDYKGMWMPLPKSIHRMSRNELICNLRKFRDAWEKVTSRNQDLHDERLKRETTKYLRRHIKFYYSDSAKNLAEGWLRK